MTLQMRLVSARLPSGEHTFGPPTYHTCPGVGGTLGLKQPYRWRRCGARRVAHMPWTTIGLRLGEPKQAC